MSLHSTAALIHKFTEFAKQMNLYLNHFPKAEKYGLALEIRRCAYEVYGLIIECTKRYHKRTTLTLLDVRHEQLRMLLSLAHDLGYFSCKDGAQAPSEGLAPKRYLTISRLVDELGRMIGGWLRSERQALQGEAS